MNGSTPRCVTSENTPMGSGIAVLNTGHNHPGVVAAAVNGLILLPCGIRGNVIRLLPPLTISDELIAEGIDLLEKTLDVLLPG